MLQLPSEFVSLMKAQLGPDWPAFEAALHTAPPVSVTYNRAKTETPLMQGQPVPWHAAGQYLPERPSFTLDPHFHAGRYYVQEAGSMLLAHFLKELQQERPLRTALDLCAAPGGKSALLLNALPPNCTLVANEVIKSRYAVLRENLAKWGRANIIATQADSSLFAPLAGQFDLVLTDAPCSGEGLFRKTPEAAAEWSLNNVQLCESRQQRILANALPLVAPGGFLLYSTCTYNRRENDGNIAWAIAQGQGSLSVFQPELPADWGITPTEYGFQCYPHRTRSEGFYLAVLKKEEDPAAKQRPAKLKYYEPADKRQQSLTAPWVNDTDGFQMLSAPQGWLSLLPDSAMPLLAALTQALPRVDPGTPLGSIKGKDLVPAHELALSIHSAPELPRLELTEAQTLDFLRKAPMEVPQGAKPGWRIMAYDGWGLGWAKLLPKRINNYLPKALRVRK